MGCEIALEFVRNSSAFGKIRGLKGDKMSEGRFIRIYEEGTRRLDKLNGEFLGTVPNLSY